MYAACFTNPTLSVIKLDNNSYADFCPVDAQHIPIAIHAPYLK